MNSLQPITALVIDDEKLSRDLVKLYLGSHPNIELKGECANGLDALNLIGSEAPDLIFLDVQMPDLNGFELLRELQAERQPAIIFTTAYDQFAMKAFDVNAVAYLLKPFGRSRFDQAVRKAVALIAQRRQPELEQKLRNLLADYDTWKASASKTPAFLSRILIKEPKKAFFLKTRDILYFEAAGDYVSACTDQKKHVFHDSLQHLESCLDPQVFIRIHRSAIVNIDAIKEMQPHFNGEYLVILKNGDQLKLSRSYKDALKHFKDPH